MQLYFKSSRLTCYVSKKMRHTKLSLLFLFFCVCADGSYLVQLTVDSYSNPSNKCAECNENNSFRGPYGCCDGFDLGVCSESERCDNYFRYCLREYGTVAETLGCTLGDEITSNFPEGRDFNRDTDFSSSRVLGLDNPFSLQEANSQWQGVQLYIQALDYDPSSDDEIIDTFSIDIPSSFVPGTPETELLQSIGRFNLASIRFRYRILCQQFFYGNNCQNYNECQAENRVCNNNGVCIDEENGYRCECEEGFIGQFCENIDYCFGVNCTNRGNCRQNFTSFTCDCDLGYTGQLCEAEINECLGVNCTGRGVCEDEVGSFYCSCDPGYTGDMCEIEIDECKFVNCSGRGQCRDGLNSFTCICSPGYTGQLCASQITVTGPLLALPELVGVTCTAAVAIILTITFVCIVLYFYKRQRQKKMRPSNLNDYRAYNDQGNTGSRIPVTPKRYVRASAHKNLSNQTNTSISHQALADPNREESSIYESPDNSTLSARNSTTRRSNISLATLISIHSENNGRDNPVYGAPDGSQLFVRNSYTRASNMSTATAITMLSQCDMRSSDERIYAEPMHRLGTPDSSEDAEEREFQNPLYQSSEDITETDSKLHSFVGAKGVYFSTIQDNECLI